MAAAALALHAPTRGLQLAEYRSRVAGTYANDSASLSFVFAIDGDVRTALLRRADGTPLVESTLADGVETTTFLGRLTIFGRPRDPEPRVVGDKTAMADLAKLPASTLFHPLRDALEAQGVARDLFAAPRPPKGSPHPWAARHLAPGEHVIVPTWSWWWPVAIDVWSWTGPARYHIQEGSAAWAETVNGWRRTTAAWSWWTVMVTNLYSNEALGVDATLL